MNLFHIGNYAIRLLATYVASNQRVTPLMSHVLHDSSHSVLSPAYQLWYSYGEDTPVDRCVLVQGVHPELEVLLRVQQYLDKPAVASVPKDMGTDAKPQPEGFVLPEGCRAIAGYSQYYATPDGVIYSTGYSASGRRCKNPAPIKKQTGKTGDFVMLTSDKGVRGTVYLRDITLI